MDLCVMRAWLRARLAAHTDLSERGANIVEYLLLVALIALAVLAAVAFLKDQLNGKFDGAGSRISSAGS